MDYNPRLFGDTARRKRPKRWPPALLLLGLGALAVGMWARAHPSASARQVGMWALQAGDVGRAQAAFARYIALDRMPPFRTVEVGGILIGDRRWEEAIALLRPAVASDRTGGALFGLGIAYDSLGRDREAEAAYRDAVERRPSSAEALNALGYFYAQRGRNLAEATMLLHRARELQPEAGGIIDSLGWALYQRGQVGPAILQLRVAAKKDPASAEIRYHLGVALARDGNRDSAVVELGKAVMLEPRLAAAREVLALARAGKRPPIPMPWRANT